MLRFAQLQLRNREAAEDLVQESIEAALRKSSSFAGQSALKTLRQAMQRYAEGKAISGDPGVGPRDTQS